MSFNSLDKTKYIHKTIWLLRNPDWLYRQIFGSNDYLLVSMQSSGTHWLRFLIAKAIVDYYKLDFQFNSVCPVEIIATLFDFPYTSSKDTGNISTMPSIQLTHRMYKAPWRIFFNRKKVILLIRDLRDAMVSQYFKFFRVRGHCPVPFEIFLADKQEPWNRAVHGSLAKRIAFLNSWNIFLNKYTETLLVVKYEDLLSNGFNTFKAILDFIGLTDVTEDFIHKTLKFGSFDNMKKIGESAAIQTNIGPAKDRSEKLIFDKGLVGSHQQIFSEKDFKYFRDVVEQQLINDFGYDYS